MSNREVQRKTKESWTQYQTFAATREDQGDFLKPLSSTRPVQSQPLVPPSSTCSQATQQLWLMVIHEARARPHRHDPSAKLSSQLDRHAQTK